MVTSTAMRRPDYLRRSPLTDLLTTLTVAHARNQAEFLLTGSMAMLGEWLRHSRLELSALSVLAPHLGDFDLLVTGAPRRSAQIQGSVTRWLNISGLEHEASADVTVSSAMSLGTSLLQCIIPATRLMLTGDGLIDTWGGAQDIASGSLRLFIPSEAAVGRNPHLTTGVEGLAVGILRWLSAHLLVRLAALHHDMPTPSLHDESLARVRSLLEPMADGSGDARATFLFGSDRVDRDRFRTLIARATSRLCACRELRACTSPTEYANESWIIEELERRADAEEDARKTPMSRE